MRSSLRLQNPFSFCTVGSQRLLDWWVSTLLWCVSLISSLSLVQNWYILCRSQIGWIHNWFLNSIHRWPSSIEAVIHTHIGFALWRRHDLIVHKAIDFPYNVVAHQSGGWLSFFCNSWSFFVFLGWIYSMLNKWRHYVKTIFFIFEWDPVKLIHPYIFVQWNPLPNFLRSEPLFLNQTVSQSLTYWWSHALFDGESELFNFASCSICP